MYRAGLIVIVALLLTACRTRLLVEDVTSAPTERRIDGIPFRVRETHTLRVFKHIKPPEGTNAKAKFEEVFTTHHPLPNPHRVFALNFRAEGFAAHEFKTELLPDSTLSTVRLKGTPSAEGAKQLGTDLVDLAETVQGLDDAIKAKEKELETAQRAEEWATFADVRTYEEKLRSLVILCSEREALLLAGEDKATELAANETSTRSLMWDLNELAIKLGRDAPFPDPNPSQYALDELCKQIADIYGTP